jgi:phosphoglycolate phosphatase-like HAD superfamily hydrolase
VLLRNVIFDWSGTLVDDLPAVLAATNFVFDQHGIEQMTLEQFRAEFCLPFKGFYDRFAPQIPLDQLERAFHSHIRGAQNVVLELPHAREFLIFCREHGLRTFLLSAIHPEHYAAQIAVNGFDAYIDRAYVAVWDKRGKIVELLQENQLDVTETLFIGDMQHDVETAQHGGVFSCAVLTGYNRLEQLQASRPDLIVEHLGQLREILERDHLELRRAVND